jgi:hypothetical protein
MESFFGLGFFFPFGILLVAAVALALIAIAGRRAAPDPTGRRVITVYLLSVMFITLLTTAGAVASLGMTAVREAITDDPVWAVTVGESFSNYTPLNPEARRYEVFGPGLGAPDLVRAALLGLIAVAIFEFHRRKWRDLLRMERGDG